MGGCYTRCMRSPLPAFVTLCVGVVSLGCAGFSSPGPWDGSQTVRAVVVAADDAPEDVDVLRSRLDALGIDATVDGDGRRVALTLREVVGPTVLDTLLRPNRITLSAPGDDRVLTNADLAGASWEPDAIGPVIVLSFTDPDPFCQLTTDHVGETIAFRIDEVVSEPVVREPICEGKARIAGREFDPRWVALLTHAASLPPLQTTWTVETLEEPSVTP